MQTPSQPSTYVMAPQQPVQRPNVIIAGSPIVSPSEVFPERYGMPMMRPMPMPMFYPPPPLVYPPRPFGYPYGPFRYGYGFY